MSTLFIGQTRFSLYAPNSSRWNLTRSKSEDDYLSALYSDDRLAPRMDIFENLSVPQLAIAADGHNVVHYVQYSSLLPEKYQVRLRSLSDRYDFLELYLNDSKEEHAGLINRVAEARLSAQGGKIAYAWYRLDDDDILGKNFFTMAEPYVTNEHAGYVLSFGRGYTAVYYNRALWDLRELFRPKTSVGQMYICSFDPGSMDFVEPPRQDHAKIDRFAPTILDSRSPNFITTLHLNQDGHQRGGSLSIDRVFKDQLQLPIALTSGQFSDVFPIVAASMQREQQIELDARGNGSNRAIQLSTEAVEFSLTSANKASEIEFLIRVNNNIANERVFVGLRYSGQIPDSFDESNFLWSKFQGNTLVLGLLTSPMVQQRIVLEPELMVGEPKLVFWHSRGLVNSSVILEFLSISGSSPTVED